MLSDFSRHLIAIASFSFLAIPSTGGAAEWAFEPAVNLRREYNDNIRLTTQPHSSVNGSIVAPSLNFSVNTPVWQTTGGASITQRRYSGEEGLDRDDNLLKISSQFRTARSTWALDANQTRDSVLADEYVSADTGVVQTQKKRDLYNIRPSWTWMFSERTQLQLAYQFTDVSYESALNVGLYDYRYKGTTATLSNQLTELTQVFVSGSHYTYIVPFTGFDSSTNNLQAGITRIFSEVTRGTLQAGMRSTESITRGGIPVYTRFSTPSGDILVQTGVTQDARTRKTGSVFSGNLETRFESTRLNIAVGRSLDPSGSGGQIEQDTMKILLNRQFSARLSAYINGNASKVREAEGNILNAERTYYDMSLGTDWQWSREWTVGLNYRYARVKRVYESESAHSNALGLTVIYQPLKMSISR